jgi:CBS domain-containing protein/sporulation protein YlmC with PRC-barrel domain
MILFSQLLRVPIIDNKQDTIGRLKDIVVKSRDGEYPKVDGVLFADGKHLSFIPYQNIETLSRGEITLNRSNCWIEDYVQPNDEFLLSQDVLDQQIFDVKGIRVVRVNDLQLVRIDNGFSVVGIDVSNKALLRRLGLGYLPFFGHMESKFVDWQNVSLVKGNVGSLQLKTTHEKLQKLHPADVANLIENLTLPESTKLVQSFDEETAAEVLGEVDPKYKDTLLEHINPKSLAKIMEEMPTDQAVDVLKDLSENKRIQVFRRLGVRKAKTLHKLSEYKDDIAGGLMTSEFMMIHKDATIGQAIKSIRKSSGHFRTLYHVFVVDDEKHLLGIVSIRTLLLSNPREKIADLMSKVVRTLRVHTKSVDIARLMTKYDLLSMAVVDKRKVLQGIVTVDDILRLLIPDA